MECHLLLLCPNTLHSSNPTYQSGVLTYCISPTKSEVFVWRSANDPGRRQYHSFDSQTRIGNHREIGGGQFPFSARIDSSCLCHRTLLAARYHQMTHSLYLSLQTHKQTHPSSNSNPIATSKKHQQILSLLSSNKSLERKSAVENSFIITCSGKAFGGYSRPSGMMTVSKQLRPPNADSPMKTTESGIATDLSALQKEKVLANVGH